MQRVKLPAGVISASQARTVAAVSTRFGQGTVHLTSRGSMEVHWLKEEDLPQVKRELAMAGLTSRGACGGAVRGITCGSQGAQGFPVLESIARRLQRHFTGNPRFERLPKKFKIGVEADVAGGRHLIQDVGLVLARCHEGRAYYDVWIAGGLGREPQAGFLLTGDLPEERVIPVIEAIIRVYSVHAPPPKRLKFLAREFGAAKLRGLIEAEAVYNEEIPVFSGLPEHTVTEEKGQQRLELPVFAGMLTAGQLVAIAEYADRHAGGVLMVTTDQDLALLLPPDRDVAEESSALQRAAGLGPATGVAALRVCPGNHECKMGLTATRDVARDLVSHIGVQGQAHDWAISGCPNSCTQPQLAAVGIISSALVKDEGGERTPRFDLYRRGDGGLGTAVAHGLTLDELYGRVNEIG